MSDSTGIGNKSSDGNKSTNKLIDDKKQKDSDTLKKAVLKAKAATEQIKKELYQ